MTFGGAIECWRQFVRCRKGAVAGMVALMAIPLVGAVGLAIDIGNVLLAKQVLQKSADAAALAGAQEIPAGGDPIAVATSYSGIAGGKNASPGISATFASGYPQVKCFKSTAAPCIGPTPANGLVVQEQSVVPTYFVKILGINSVAISATATAG